MRLVVPHAWLDRATALHHRELTRRGVVCLHVLVLGVSAWVAVQVGDELGPFFGLCFVLTAVTGALAAHDRALFTAAVVPPLALVALVLIVSLLAPDAVASDAVDRGGLAGALARTAAGLVRLATALVVGHLAALLVVAARVRVRAPAPV